MKKTKKLISVISSIFIAAGAFAENPARAQDSASAQAGSPIRPLAQNYVEVGHSPREGKYLPLYTPSIVRGMGKRLIGSL